MIFWYPDCFGHEHYDVVHVGTELRHDRQTRQKLLRRMVATPMKILFFNFAHDRPDYMNLIECTLLFIVA
ncbi:MAG: hypothetical protein R2861_14120 [Desulfobacterales bacterium]